MPRTCDEAAQHATQLALSRHRAGVSTTPANVWPPFQLFAQRQGPVCRPPARATGWATRTQPGLQPHQPVRTPAFWSNAFRRLPGTVTEGHLTLAEEMLLSPRAARSLLA